MKIRLPIEILKVPTKILLQFAKPIEMERDLKMDLVFLQLS